MLSTPCRARYLFDLGCWEGLEGPCGVFCEGFEYDSTDFPTFSLVRLKRQKRRNAQIQLHPNGIAPNHNIIPTLQFVKPRRLPSDNLRRQPPINNSRPHPRLPLHLFLNREYRAPLKRNDTITLLNLGQIPLQTLFFPFGRASCISL